MTNRRRQGGGGFDWRTICIPLPHAPALDFMSERLGQGHPLARCILASGMLAEGSFFSTLPQTVSVVEATQDFYLSGVYGRLPDVRGYHVMTSGELVPIHDQESGAMQMVISDWLGSEDRAICVIEDEIRGWQDPITKPSGTVVFFQKDSYVVLTHRDADDVAKVSEVIRQNRDPWLEIAVLTRAGSDPLSHHQTIERSVVEGWAAEAQGVIAGAYDGEGQVVWVRD